MDRSGPRESCTPAGEKWPVVFCNVDREWNVSAPQTIAALSLASVCAGRRLSILSDVDALWRTCTLCTRSNCALADASDLCSDEDTGCALGISRRESTWMENCTGPRA